MSFCMSGPRNLKAHLETHRQMQPLQVCTVSNRKLEDADENAQWKKAKLMQPMHYGKVVTLGEKQIIK